MGCKRFESDTESRQKSELKSRLLKRKDRIEEVFEINRAAEDEYEQQQDTPIFERVSS